MTQPSNSQIDALNKRLEWQMQGSGLRYIKLNEAELQIVKELDVG